MTTEDNVRAEYERFQAQLPELLKLHPGKWVVFRENSVQSVHDSVDEAIASALARFGVGGYVVAPVIETKPTPLTAAVMFGHVAH